MINKFKHALQGNKPLFGLWQGIPNTTVAEIGAGAGFDWVLIDSEHAPFDVQSIMAHLQAISIYPVSPIVRPVEGDTALIKQLLDVGVQTLLVPMVNNAAQAKAIVAATRYPPQGIRGLGTSMARAANWNREPDYLTKANNEMCVLVQIETIEGLKNVEEISAVEGVDGVFFGPSDLSASMGYLGNPGHPDVVKSISKAFQQVHALGKQTGVLAVTKALADSYIESGAKFIGVGVDASLLANATKQLAATFIGHIDKSDNAGY
jgi:4-hydroxy-2-oxoheptanedioate aldolase